MVVYPNIGGMNMIAEELWRTFLETGAPEAYVLFSRARQMEEPNVLDNQGSSASGNGLQ